MERAEFEQWKAKEVARLLALVETERRYYQEIVAALPIGLMVLAPDGSILSANRALRRLFNVRAEDLRRRTFDQLIPSELLGEKITSAISSGIVQQNLFLTIPAEQGPRLLRIAILPIRNWDEENGVEALLVVEDLSEVERLRAASGISVEQVETVSAPEPPAPARQTVPPGLGKLGEAPAIVYTADSESLVFSSVLGSVESLLGFTAEHWAQTPNFFAERIHPQDRESTLRFLHGAIDRGGDHNCEYRAVAADGRTVWCRETVRVLAKSATQPRLVGVITDITARRQMEEQLLQSQRIDAMSGLCARLAHDLNNPLMIVTGYCEEVQASMAPTDPLRADVAEILKATERISDLTGHLLLFTRRQALAPKPVNLARLLAFLEERIQLTAGENVGLELASQPDDIWVSADPGQLGEIITTLTSGAREDTAERTRVSISYGIRDAAESLGSSARLQPGRYAELVVRDNGRGIEAERRCNLFESFLPDKDPERDLGPALWRAYATVREWGGDIWVSSEPLRGTAFFLYLPLAEAEARPVHLEPPAAEEPAEPEHTLETVLVVEDEIGIRALIRKILRRQGYQVLEAGSAEEALRLAMGHAGPIHLLLTDVVMSGMNGRELADRLTPAFPDLRVLYISGYTDDASIATGQFPPGTAFLQKPFTLGALLKRVRDVLDAKTA